MQTFPSRAPMVCASGREREAYRLLSQLAKYDWTLEELDIAMSFPRVETDVLVAHWQACELFAPRRLAGRTPDRMLLTEVDLSINYAAFPELGLTSSELRDAILVSSRCLDGLHRPALDLDFPVALLEDAAGVQWLWLDPSSSRAVQYHGPQAVVWADRAMAAVGLVRSGGPAAGPSGTLSDLAPLGRMADGMAHGWCSSFESLWQTLVHLEPASRGVRPEGGVWYRVEGRAQLVPSTSWWHLYTDVALETGTYLDVLDALAACGILNSGFALASRVRGFSSLRRPGLRKPPHVPVVFEPADLDDIPF